MKGCEGSGDTILFFQWVGTSKNILLTIFLVTDQMLIKLWHVSAVAVGVNVKCTQQ